VSQRSVKARLKRLDDLEARYKEKLAPPSVSEISEETDVFFDSITAAIENRDKLIAVQGRLIENYKLMVASLQRYAVRPKRREAK